MAESASIYSDTVKLVSELAKNPIVELILAFAVIEILQDRGVIGDLQGNLMEAGVAGIITAQQLSPILPDLLKSAGGISSIAGLIGAVA